MKTLNDSFNLNIKTLFHFPKDINGRSVIELRALTHGLQPKSVPASLEAFTVEWKESGVDSWNELNQSASVFLVGDESEQEKAKKFGWWTLPEVIGDRFISRLLDAPQGTCIMMSNATQIVFSLLSCKELNQPGRRKVICTDGEFPAVLHSLHHFNRQFEAYSSSTRAELELDICMVDMGNDPFDDDKIISQIDDKTALVIFSHIGFVRGERVPDEMLKRISEKAHERGALVAIDAYHAVGNKTIHVQDLGVDVYFGGLLKEGCGSSGNAFIYIREGLELTPSISGWFGDKVPFAFAQKPEINPSVRRRFLAGTTPIAPLYHAVDGLKIMFQIGLERVEKDVLDKVEKMTKQLLTAGLTLVSPTERDRMSSLIVLHLTEANKLRDYLADEHAILVDARRNEFLRLAAHVYNSPEELEHATHAIIDAVSSGAYLNYSVVQKSGPVT